MSDDRELSIWFFVGISVLVNGALVLGAGVYELFVPPAEPLVLANLHAPIWWGVLMVVLGAAYTVKFRPERPGTAEAK